MSMNEWLTISDHLRLWWMCNWKRLRASEEEQGIDMFTGGEIIEGNSPSILVQTMMWMSFGAFTKVLCSMAERGQYYVNLTI